MTYPRINASDDLIWQCIKKHSAFTRKFGKLVLSTEKGNLTNCHSKRTSGLMSNSVSVYAGKGRKIRGCRTTKSKSNPGRRVQELKLSCNPKCTTTEAKVNMLAAVRPDLEQDIKRKICVLARL
eukprot:Gregarina_sp_Poly_1__10846@NODE_83_length_15529_cov_95_045531_g71_i0_p16_GENE_NODE_83_length_15529_cov_95_045531_g71_i0NODE_83_length_15529_cov_95_045531_g71_i0_p16_ORF_typecomplete_len124_score10_86Ribosomal_L28e/PF01778_17/3_3e13_NODE_83_length_15529_cov_95_045531_g71_i058566227